jgi:hypothetical protein
MIRKLIAAAAFAVAMAPVALAQDGGAPKFSSTTSTFAAIIDNAEAKAALDKVFPGTSEAPELQPAMEMTPDAVKAFAPEIFTEEKLKELDAELAKIK